VLCIDDFRPGLETRKAFLEQFGFGVMTASCGQEGLKLLKEKPTDVVILDYRMPEMNGLEVALRIRQDFGEIPILLLSGFSRQVPAELKKIVNCHLTKGDPPDFLLAALDEVTGTTVHARRAARRMLSPNPDPMQQKRRAS